MTTAWIDDVLVFGIRGPLDTRGAARLALEVRTHVRHAPQPGALICVDLCNVTAAEYGGARLLVAITHTSERHGARLTFAVGPGAVAGLLRQTRLARILPLHPTLQSAIAALTLPSPA